jgi:membrane-associated PAP2 superfamily phosphatase
MRYPRAHTISDEKRRFLPDVLLFAGAAIAAAAFSWTDLDLRVSSAFYDPTAPGGPWPAADRIPWSLLHHLTPWLAAGLGFWGLGLIVRGMLDTSRRDLRLDGLLIVFGLALGPGLVINAIFKDNWKRPRPRQTITLGGDHAYVPPLRIGPAGKSFPCGHCSVGFAYGALYYALRRSRPAAARGWLAASAAGGAVLGFGRVASGGHFASDVVFAAILTYGTLVFVHHALLRLPRQEETAARPPRPGRTAARSLASRTGLVAAACTLLIVLVLLATPFEQPLGRSFDEPRAATGESWRLVARTRVGHLRLILQPEGDLFTSAGSFDGFGFPGMRLKESLRVDAQRRRIDYFIEPKGWFTDLEGQATIRIAAPAVASVEVEVEDGLLTIETMPGVSLLPELACRIRADALRLRGGLRRDQVRVMNLPE